VSGDRQAVVPQLDAKPAIARGQANTRVDLEMGHTISGELHGSKPGRLVGFGVKIGNYKNRSDGNLTIEVCQLNRCSGATSNLVGSENNKYLNFKFSDPIDIVADKSVEWTITKASGNHPVAVWIYPLDDNAAAVTLPDGSHKYLSPRISLIYGEKSVE
jgi:hypothetical protein